MSRSSLGVPWHEVGGFLVVGLFGVIADIGTFNLALLQGVDPVAASLLGFVLGVMVSFLGNHLLTFRHREVGHLGRAWGTFVLINAVAVGLIQAVVWLGATAGLAVLGLNAVRTTAIAAATVGRFFAYRRWVFVAPR